MSDFEGTLSVLEVMTPQWSDFVLAANIPHSEADVFILYSLNIKAWEGKQTSQQDLVMNNHKTTLQNIFL